MAIKLAAGREKPVINESLTQQAISRLISVKPVVVIAPRLRTIVDADQIIVLNEGCLEEQGTHQGLFDINGLYYKLYSTAAYVRSSNTIY